MMQLIVNLLSLVLLIVLPFDRALVSGVFCPDGKSFCSLTSTCCLMKTGSYGCCPYINATCCADRLHCCPSGYLCGIGRCLHKANESAAATHVRLEKLADITISIANTRLCSDGQSECMVNQTCCPMKQQRGFSCCIFPQAQCCSDGEHCCPKELACGPDGHSCVHPPSRPGVKSLQVDSTRLVAQRPLPAQADPPSAAPHAGFNICGFFQHICGNNQTCCRSRNSSWSCCPLKNAVCCANGLSCCPWRHVCQNGTSRCIPTGVGGSLLSVLSGGGARPATSLLQRPATEFASFRMRPAATTPSPSGRPVAVPLVCPDRASLCPSSNNTCCRLPDRSYGCCPLPNATCCADGLHCCPHQYACEPRTNTCIHRIRALPAVAWSRKLPAVSTESPLNALLRDGRALVERSGGAAPSCGQRGLLACRAPAQPGSDPFSPGQAAPGERCCSHRNGTCCGSGEFCCPAGYRCSLDDSLCLRLP